MKPVDFDVYSETVSRPHRYLIGACFLVAAFVIRLLSLPLDYGAQFLTFYPAVALCFYLLGAELGVVALLLSAVAGYYFYFPPYASWKLTTQSVGSALMFTVSSGFIGYIIHRLHIYRGRSVAFERQKLTELVKDRDMQLELAVDGARLGICRWDLERNKVSVSGACCAHFGLPAAVRELGYEDFLKLIHSGDRIALINTHAKAIETGDDFEVDYRVIRPDGRERWLSSIGRPYFSRDGAIQHVDGIVIDITKRKSLESELQQLNNELDAKVRERTTQLTQANEALAVILRHDPLTGLSNRLAANEHLRSEFGRMKRTGGPYAVLMMDIDLFKQVNDTYGHAVGDEVLKHVATLVRDNLRVNDFISRFGGEEFLILLPSTGLQQACIVAEKIRAAIESAPHETAGKVTVSIGVALASPEQTDPETAVKAADDQLYLAKNGGRNRVAAMAPDSAAVPQAATAAISC